MWTFEVAVAVLLSVPESMSEYLCSVPSPSDPSVTISALMYTLQQVGNLQELGPFCPRESSPEFSASIRWELCVYLSAPQIHTHVKNSYYLPSQFKSLNKRKKKVSWLNLTIVYYLQIIFILIVWDSTNIKILFNFMLRLF